MPLICAGACVAGRRLDLRCRHGPCTDIRLTAPQLHEGLVTLDAINVGDAPGSLRASTIESPMLGGLIPLTSSSASDEFVPVGALAPPR